MKKTICFILAFALMLASFSVSAAPPDGKPFVTLLDFEDATNENVGNSSSDIIGVPDDHSPWNMTEGFYTVTDKGESGKALEITPNYNNEQGFTISVTRAVMKRVTGYGAPAEEAEAIAKAWGEAYGLRIWVHNTSEYDLTFCPILKLQNVVDGVADPSSLSIVGLCYGAYLVADDGEIIEPDFDGNLNNRAVIIPMDFRGWVVIPNKIYDPAGDMDEYDCGWQELEGWSSTFNAEAASFAHPDAFALDIRAYNIMPDSEGGLIVDSFQLYGSVNDVEPTKTPKATPTPTQQVTNAPSATAAATTAAQTTGATDDDASDNSWLLYAGIAAAAVVVIVVVVLIAKGAKKKGDEADADTTDSTDNDNKE